MGRKGGRKWKMEREGEGWGEEDGRGGGDSELERKREMRNGFFLILFLAHV